jgi:hypothetical protein
MTASPQLRMGCGSWVRPASWLGAGLLAGTETVTEEASEVDDRTLE